MEQITKLIRSDYIFKIGETTGEVECSMPIENGSAKPISYSANAIVTSAEPLNGECSVKGKVNFKTILCEGTQFSALDYFADVEFVVNGNVLPTMKVSARAEVTDVNVFIEGDVAKGTASVLITLYGLSVQETSALISAEDACLLEEKVKSSTLLGVHDGRATLYDEFDAGRVRDVILTGNGASIRETSCKNGVIKVLGDARAKVLYTTADGNTYMHTFNLPFAEEIAADCVDENCNATAYATVENVKLILSGTDDDTEIRAEITLCIRADVWKIEDVDVVKDAFCTDVELAVERCTKAYSYPKATFALNEDVKKSITLPPEMPGIEKIIGVVSEWNVTTNTAIADGKVLIEGVVSGNSLYVNRDGGISCLPFEVPYSSSHPVQRAEKTDLIIIATDVSEVGAYARGDAEIELSVKLTFCCTCYDNGTTCAVISCKEGEKKQRVAHPITVRFGEPGAKLWQTAKSLNVSPETLMESNPELVFPLKGGEKILEYHPILCE